MVVPTNSSRLTIPTTMSAPRVRKWLGDKVVKALRALVQDIDVDPWEATIGIERKYVDYDSGGTVTAMLTAFLGREVTAFDDVVFQTLLDNPVGHDGVSLLNDSHPYSNSTGDNLTTDALSYSSWVAMKAQMADFTDEDGTPLGVRPNVLLVGPSNEQKALEITGAQRAVAITSSGVEGTSSVVAAYMRDNPYGQAAVLVADWITGGQWFAMDLTKPGMKPLVVAEARAFEPITQDEMTDESRFRRDKYLYSLEGDYGVGAGLWQLIGGRIAA